MERQNFFCTVGLPKIQIQCKLHNYHARMLILPMNIEYIKGPTKVINNLANGLRQISKPYNVNAKQLYMYVY